MLRFLKIGHIVLNECVRERDWENEESVFQIKSVLIAAAEKTFISLYFKSQTDCDDAKQFHHEMHSHLQVMQTLNNETWTFTLHCDYNTMIVDSSQWLKSCI